MKIGILRETKANEGRVALVPHHANELVLAGHQVLVESGAGDRAGFVNADYKTFGCEIADQSEIWSQCTIILKVKEIEPDEYGMIKKHHIIMANLHPAANRELRRALKASKCTSFAMEDAHRDPPTNYIIAGEFGAFEGLRLACHRSGKHFAPHFGADPVVAAVIGIGNVGRAAIRALLPLGVTVFAYNRNLNKRRDLAALYPDRSLFVDHVDEFASRVRTFDLIINAIKFDKVNGKSVVTSRMVKNDVKDTAVLVDLSCDQAGGIETSIPTTWKEPTYEKHGILHFAVENIGGVPCHTASMGYSESIIPQVLDVANRDVMSAMHKDPLLARALVTMNGTVYHNESNEMRRKENG